MIKKRSQILNISSLNAINGDYKSQISVSIPDCNFSNPNVKAVYFSVQHCEVPNSFYIVNYTNNILTIDNIQYVIQRGNYNTTTLMTYLLTILPSGFGITYSNITNKFTMTYSSNFTINGGLSTINKVMGFSNDNITSFANTLTFGNCVNFLPLARLNFKSNLFKFGNYSQNNGSGDIFLSLQNNAPAMGVINYSNSSNLKFYMEDKAITTFIISVCDDNGNLINFNGVEWFMTLQIDTEIFEPEKTLNFQNIVGQQFTY